MARSPGMGSMARFTPSPCGRATRVVTRKVEGPLNAFTQAKGSRGSTYATAQAVPSNRSAAVRKMAPFREMASHAMVAIFPQYVFW